MKTALTIAGSDSSGGAGIQADMKTMIANGVYAMSAITALTAQNTTGVQGIFEVTPEFLEQEIDSIFTDIYPDAVKIGMLGAQDVMAAVAQALRAHEAPKIVLDTVMVAKSGDRLMPDDAVAFFKEELLPLADVITPNLPEASVLLGHDVRDMKDMYAAAQELWDMCGGKTAVYLKGGHSVEETLRDVFYDGKAFIDLDGPRVHTKNTHGTGCSLSSAIAALWARTEDLPQAVRLARRYIEEAITASDDLTVGSGHGPIHHFVRFESLFS